ncbi:MFS transporter [Streptomyces erythrochromogenes]|uniref:MFS transporter n=1 Tax=Streptomyces erythrochromogenes TaxID=285574 RepID=UPI00341FC085
MTTHTTTRTSHHAEQTAGPAVTYLAILRTPNVLRLLAGAVIGHLPVAMAPLALLISARAAGGTIGQAGLLAAAYGLAAALGQPAWGRMLDRRGQPATLVLTAAMSTLAFTALTMANPVSHPAAAVLLTITAGLFTPPLEAALRVLWPQVVARPAEQRAALALDACAQEIVFILGPLLVLALDAAAGPAFVLGVTTLLGLAGTSLFATTWPSRKHRPALEGLSDWRGPLRAVGPRILAVALLGAGAALGALNVVALTLAEQQQSPALTTLIPAALAVGSLSGGLLYGRRTWPGSSAAQLLAATCGLLAGLVPLLAAPAPPFAATAAFLPGLFLAPLLVISFASLDHLAPHGTLGEASAWLIALLGLGQALGTAVAGAVGDYGPVAPTAIAVTGAALAVTVVALARGRLSGPPADHVMADRTALPSGVGSGRAR